MALFVHETNVSTAWVTGLEALLANGGDAVNLTVAIDDPTSEDDDVRALLDHFNGERRRRDRKSVELVSTVANTLFPSAWYAEHLGEKADEHLYELERQSRAVNHRRNKSGTYFERMVAWPGPQGEFNQLDQVVRRLRSARLRGHQRGNAYEIGVAQPSDEAIAVPILVGGKDRKVRGFPCLSHLSFSLQEGTVHLSAMYRSHDFISRAYGNYLGLGRVLRFVGRQSGIPIGELTCISSSAARSRNWPRNAERLWEDRHDRDRIVFLGRGRRRCPAFRAHPGGSRPGGDRRFPPHHECCRGAVYGAHLHIR